MSLALLKMPSPRSKPSENAGGVICAAVEYHGGTETRAFAAIEAKIRANTGEMLERLEKSTLLPRQAAVQMTRERVQEAMGYHRT